MAGLVSLSVSAFVLFIYIAWHGANQDPRVAASIGERIRSIPLHFLDYGVVMPAIGLGLFSIPLAVKWALPYSLLILLGGVTLGWSVGPRLLHSETSPAAWPNRSQVLVAFLLLVTLINFPVAAGPYHPHSPRVFTPTWLALVMFVAFVGSNSKWASPRWIAGIAGVLIAGIILSLALSVSVRVHSANIAERAFHVLAQRLPGGGVIAVCDVQRTIVEPAPNGDFAAHPFILAPVAESGLQYYTGVRAVFHLTGPLWGTHCTGQAGVDFAIQFRDLVAKSKTW
jgi:hypothetical protein